MATIPRFEFTSDVTRWERRRDVWLFAHVPLELAEEIDSLPVPRGGFGSLRVQVTIGTTTWRTSVFPSGDGRFALALKRAVRDREGIAEGDLITVSLELVDLPR
ncbi:MAG: DUF1905 domain-containing protein [Propionibacteriaceae bacterium]|nr:DUF1905 domain-containing protein [Propionibacteriaceae bacterium]